MKIDSNRIACRKAGIFEAARDAFSCGRKFGGSRPEDLPPQTLPLTTEEVFFTVQLQDSSICPCELSQEAGYTEVHVNNRRIPLHSPEVRDLFVNRIVVEIAGRWFLLLLCNRRGDILLQPDGRNHRDIGLTWEDPRDGFGGWEGTVSMITQSRTLAVSILDNQD